MKAFHKLNNPKSFLIHTRFSRINLAMFGLAFGAIGVYGIIASFADSAGTITVNLANASGTCSTQLTSQDTYGYQASMTPPTNGDPNIQERYDALNTTTPAVWRAMANGGYNTLSTSEPSPADIYPAGQTAYSPNQTGNTDLMAWSFAALDKQLSIAPTNDAREVTIPSPPDALFTGVEGYDFSTWEPPSPGTLADPTYSQLADYMADLVAYYRSPMVVSSSGSDTNGGTGGPVTYTSTSLTDPNVDFSTTLINFSSGKYTVTATAIDNNGYRDWEQGVVTSISGTNNDTLNFSAGWSKTNSYANGTGVGMPSSPATGAAYNLDTTAPPSSAPDISTANNAANIGKGWNTFGSYNAGTISQSGTIITGLGTTFTSDMTGATIKYSDGSVATVTYVSPTSLTSSLTKTVSAGSSYTIFGGSQWNGLKSFSYATPWPRPPSVGNVQYFEMFNEPEYTQFGDRQIPQVLPPTTVAPSIGGSSGGSLAPGTYYYKITGIDSRGNETDASTEVSQQVSSVGQKITLNWSPSPTVGNLGQEPTAYRIYRSTSSGQEKSMLVVGKDSSAYGNGQFTWTDDGSVSSSTSTPPSSNNSQAMQFLWMPGEYVQMWNAVAPAMKAIDPTIKFTGPTQGNDGEVLGPYTDPTALTSGTSWKSDEDFIQALMALPSANGAAASVRPSAITFHNYGGYQGDSSTEANYWNNLFSTTSGFLHNFNTNGNSGESDASAIASADSSLGTSTQVWVDETNINSNYLGTTGNYQHYNLEAETQLGAAWLAAEFAEVCKQAPTISQLNTWSIQNNESWALFYGGYWDSSNHFQSTPPAGCYPSNSCGNLSLSEPNLEYWVMREIDQYFPANSEIVPVSGVPSGFDAFAVRPPSSNHVSVVVINTQQDTNTPPDGSNSGAGDGSGVPGIVNINLTGGSVADTKQVDIDQSTNLPSGPIPSDLGAGQSNITLNMKGFGVSILDYTLNPTGSPVVTTTAATNLTTNSATLNGSVNPDGQATSYYFEYGTTASYGTNTATQSAGSDSNAAPEAVTLSGLQTGTIYHYRLVATNASGTSYGGDQSFTTGASPPPSNPPSYKPGDVNHDGVVNIYDLSILLSHYGTNYPNAEFTGHSTVTIYDLSTLLSRYGGVGEIYREGNFW